ncbi:hypothetical protein [Gaopeijia maritima]|uniref:Uncharacterized protein n=1 Tax=Gaopeijia maritima TaxID=3119007 RepID=A0ABU9E9Y4_9BACT
MNAVRRARLLSVVVLAVVFGSGILVGFALDRRLDMAEMARMNESRLAADVDDANEDADRTDDQPRRYLFERVDPTDAQRVRIDSIVALYQSDVRRFHRESRQFYDDGMRALVLETREAIKGVLDPDQAARYDSLAVDRDRRNQESERDRNDDGNDER